MKRAVKIANCEQASGSVNSRGSVASSLGPVVLWPLPQKDYPLTQDQTEQQETSNNELPTRHKAGFPSALPCSVFHETASKSNL